MAGEDFKNKIEFDVGEAGAALERLSKQIEKYNVSVENLVRAEKVMNEQGKITEISLKFLNEAGLKLTASLDGTGRGFKEAITGMSQVDDIAKRLTETEKLAAKALAETSKAIEIKRKNLEGLRVAQEAANKANVKAAQAEQAQKVLTGFAGRATGGRINSATPAEISALNTAINKVVDNVQRGEFTLKEFNDALRDVGINGEKALLGIGTALAKSVNQTRAALSGIGSEEAELTRKTQEEHAKRVASEEAAAEKRRRASRDGLAQQQADEIKSHTDGILRLAKEVQDELEAAEKRRKASRDGLAQQKADEVKAHTDGLLRLAKEVEAELRAAEKRRKASRDALAQQKEDETKAHTEKLLRLAKEVEAQLKSAQQARIALNTQRREAEEERRRNQNGASVTRRLPQAPGNIGLDQLAASQATLARINALFASGTVTLRDYTIVQRALANNTVSQLTPAQVQLAQALRQLEADYNGAARAGNTAQRITLSYAGIMRLFIASAFHRGFSLLTNAFRDATFEAINFGVSISEIQTVSLNSEKSFKQWSAEIANLSNSFGIETAQVAKATYEALSNQVVEGAQSFQFMAETAKFAIVAVTSMENAANLTSSAINSFGLNQANAAQINAEFFKGIELGRFTAEDLANTYGRVAATANALGASNAELLATLTVLTRQGVDAAEAQTLINNVMLKLIKPTEEMKELFGQWGVASGQAAIAAFGLDGVLSKLNDESLKGVNRTSELLNEFRSLRGGLGLTSEGFKAYLKDLEEIKNASKADFDKAFTTVMQTDAKKLQIEFNKLKNFFVQDFGVKFTKTFRELADSFGGLVPVVKRTLSLFGAFTAGFVAFRAVAASNILAGVTLGNVYTTLTARINATSIATARLTLANRVLNASSLPILAISAAVGAIAYFFTRAALSADDFGSKVAEATTKAEEAASKYVQARIAEEVKLTDSTLANLETRFRAFLQYASRISVAANALTKAAEEANQKSAQSFKDYIDALADQVNKVVSRAEDRAKKLLDLVTKSKEKIAELQADGEKSAVDRSLAKTNDPNAQAGIIQAEIDRLNALTVKAADDYKAALLAGNTEAALASLQNAESLTARQKELAEQLFRLRAQQFDALESKEQQAAKAKLTAERQALTAQSAANEKARAAALAELNAAERARAANNGRGAGGLTPAQVRALDEKERKARQALNKADDADAKIVDRQRILDEIAAKQVANNAAIVTAEQQILKLEQQRIEALTKISELAEKERIAAEKAAEAKKLQQEQLKTSADNLLKFKPEVDANTVAATDADPNNDVEEIKAKAAAELQKQLAEFDRLAEEVKKNAANFDVNARLQLEEQLAARKKALEEKLQAELTGITANAIIQRATLEKEALEKQARESGQAVTDAMTEASTAASAVLGPLEVLRDQLDEDGQALLDRVKLQIEAAQKTGNVNFIQPAINALLKLAELQREVVKSNEGGLGAKDEFFNEQFKKARETQIIIERLLANTVAFKKSAAEVTAAQGQNKAVQDRINEAAKAWEGFTAAATTAGASNAAVNLDIVQRVDNTAARIQALSAAYSQLAAQINAANVAGGGQPVKQALGGMPFFANGGQARQGLDLFNARLQKGEFVVNQRSTSRFYNQLVAMNSGREPRNFSQGGSVTTVGDVNVTVQGGDSSEQTLQAIGKGINRQLRLNKLRWKG